MCVVKSFPFHVLNDSQRLGVGTWKEGLSRWRRSWVKYLTLLSLVFLTPSSMSPWQNCLSRGRMIVKVVEWMGPWKPLFSSWKSCGLVTSYGFLRPNPTGSNTVCRTTDYSKDRLLGFLKPTSRRGIIRRGWRWEVPTSESRREVSESTTGHEQIFKMSSDHHTVDHTRGSEM